MTTEFERIADRFASSLGEAAFAAQMNRHDRRALLLAAYKEAKAAAVNELVALSGYPERLHLEPLRDIMRFVPLNEAFGAYHKEGTLAGFRKVVRVVQAEVGTSMASELEQYARYLAETPSEYLTASLGEQP